MQRWMLVLFLSAGLASTLRAQVGDSAIVVSTRGAVVSDSRAASEVGARILARGGNAVDAAVAVAFALAVTFPAAGNIGGGGFMVIRSADGSATTIDYRETAPRAATREMFVTSPDSNEDYRTVGVPGTVRGLALAHGKFGRLPWRDVVSPAADLAAHGFTEPGFPVHLGTGARSPATRRAFSRPDGQPFKRGDTITLPDLARALNDIATRGPDVFYRGWIADSIVADMARHGGLLTKEDLSAYEAIERAPLRGTFQGFDVITMGPPSGGGAALIEILNILEPFKLAPGDHESMRSYHLIVEAMRRAFLDRARYMGDPGFTSIPLQRLLSKQYARSLAGSIDPTRSSSSTLLGKDILSPGRESMHTTHFSVVDAMGGAVSNTYTLNAPYGSDLVASGTGFLLNNEMGDFNTYPGVTDSVWLIGTQPNVIAPGKRMLSSMTPTIVTSGGKLFMVTGAPGGRTIINTVAAVILNATAFRMTPADALNRGRFHHQWMPDRVTFEKDAVSATLADSLRAIGHSVEVQRFRGQGGAHTIFYDADTKTARAIADPRDRGAGAASPSRPR